jgi:P27 family predicted phage terminase small subunit
MSRKRGPSPTPTSLKRLRGTIEKAREARRGKYERQPEVDLSNEPPHWMTDDQQASWRYAMAHAPHGLLKAIDKGVLVIWCEAEARHRQATMAQQRLDAGKEWPMLQLGHGGRPVISPYLRVMNHAALIMLRCADALGFSPASRPRIQLITGPAPPPVIDGEVELDPWEALARLHGRERA